MPRTRVFAWSSRRKADRFRQGEPERALQDLLAYRDILSESLNLYRSMVSHRTNAVMNRLTVISVIFLPLSFMGSIRGMSFGELREP